MKTALLVIDVQMAFVHDDAAGAERSCREAEANIETLLKVFRDRGDKVVHIHHHGSDADDPFNANAPGAVVQPFAAPTDGEAVVVKHVASGFVGTSLEEDLRAEGVERLVVCGATANHCAESTTRSAGNLGFDTIYTADAVWAYGATGPDGIVHDAEQIHSVTLANLHGEFATVLPTEGVLKALS
ncbi:Isochorismatase family protein YecD [Roseovarius albus]|uniref:Isochorismatase family protein YecD n=1 Tax=Roseovarius albus TaxID=1247867 RepID=A0A1X6YFK2_9RHOB|nr:isochorismatase family protein [Roseovarius albus]SLN19983.1 Isochorismatase family protein YecD [Roseovarius albus]